MDSAGMLQHPGHSSPGSSTAKYDIINDVKLYEGQDLREPLNSNKKAKFQRHKMSLHAKGISIWPMSCEHLYMHNTFLACK